MVGMVGVVGGWSADGRKVMVGLPSPQNKATRAQDGRAMSEAEIAAWVRYGGDRGKATVVKHH